MARDWTDEEKLFALHCRHNKGMTFPSIAAALGATKNQVVGLLNQIRIETDKYDHDGNQNGTMPHDWWKDGLSRRRE
jgi:hypothetical protein